MLELSSGRRYPSGVAAEKKLSKPKNALLSRALRDAELAALKKNYAKAQAIYVDALGLFAGSPRSYGQSLDVYMNLAELLFFQKKYDEAATYFGEATKVPGGLGYPRLHLRLGQIRFEQGALAKAKDELMRAYMGDGEEIFENLDRKYFKLIQPLLKKK